MKGERLYVYAVPGARHALVRGSLGMREWFRDKGIPAMWSRGFSGFLVRSERVPDICAMAGHEGWAVQVHQAAPRRKERKSR